MAEVSAHELFDVVRHGAPGILLDITGHNQPHREEEFVQRLLIHIEAYGMLGLDPAELHGVLAAEDPLETPCRLGRYVVGLVGAYGGRSRPTAAVDIRGCVGDVRLAALLVFIVGDPYKFLCTCMVGLFQLDRGMMSGALADMELPEPLVYEVAPMGAEEQGRAIAEWYVSVENLFCFSLWVGDAETQFEPPEEQAHVITRVIGPYDWEIKGSRQVTIRLGQDVFIVSVADFDDEYPNYAGNLRAVEERIRRAYAPAAPAEHARATVDDAKEWVAMFLSLADRALGAVMTPIFNRAVGDFFHAA
ncbi:MAG: hypothetical protein LBS56_09425 [Propionibacteriaceae bacterium]|jgi:hypothetical protein|nr:hypothetical protein [Propionibacteriaceae bacterium]